MTPRLPNSRAAFGHAARRSRAAEVLSVLLLAGFNAAAQTNSLSASTNAVSSVSLSGSMPDAGLSLLRVMGALAVVLGIFLGGVWLFRNWQRLAIRRGHAPKLNVLEVRSLGGRHALYVVAYENERFLLAASPTGVNLVSHLQPGEDPAPGTGAPAPQSFAQALTQTLKGK